LIDKQSNRNFCYRWRHWTCKWTIFIDLKTKESNIEIEFQALKVFLLQK